MHLEGSQLVGKAYWTQSLPDSTMTTKVAR